MPGQTTSGWPYPVGSDATHDYPATGKVLADKLQADVGIVQRGSVTTAADGSATVTFPRPFTSAPTVVVSCSGTQSDRTAVVGAVNGTQFGVTVYQGGTATSGGVQWIAIGA